MGVQWGRMVTDLAQADRAAADGFDFVHAAAPLVPGLVDDEVVRPETLAGRRSAASGSAASRSLRA